MSGITGEAMEVNCPAEDLDDRARGGRLLLMEPTRQKVNPTKLNRLRKTCWRCVGTRMKRDLKWSRRSREVLGSIQKNSVSSLTYFLNCGYPVYLIYYCLFFAIYSQSWDCLDQLLEMDPATDWIQFCYQREGNILQRVVSKFRDFSNKDRARSSILNMLDVLHRRLSEDCLRTYVNLPFIADVKQNKNSTNSMTALHLAIKESLLAVVVELLRCGADPNLATGHGETPLMLAVRTGDVYIIDAIVLFGAKGNTGDVTDDNIFASPLWKLVCDWPSNGEINKKNRDLLCHTLEAYDSISLDEYRAILPFINQNLMSRLTAKGLPLTFSEFGEKKCPCDVRQCALVYTGVKSNTEALEVLCQSLPRLDIDINKDSSLMSSLLEEYTERTTALQAACIAGRPDSVKCLLSFGADPNCGGHFGTPPIMHVMEYRRPDAIQCTLHLIRYGCDLNDSVTPKFMTGGMKLSPIDFFILSNQLFVVRMLVAAGARTFCIDNLRQVASSDVDVGEFVLSQEREVIPSTLCTDRMRQSVLDDLLSVPSLCQLSRTAVRQTLCLNISEKIQTLPVPNLIKEFLDLPELDDIAVEFGRAERRLIKLYRHNIIRDSSSSDVELVSSSDESSTD